MARQWQFVSHEDNGSSLTTESRKTVRENAMRAYRRMQRLERIKQHRKENVSDPSDNGCESHEFTKPAKENDQGTTPALHTGVHQGISALRLYDTLFGGIDPFASTVIDASYNAPQLFSYFIYSIVPRILPKWHSTDQDPIATSWAKNALTDPVLLATILFHAGVYEDSCRGDSWSSTTLYHRGQSIHLLKQRIEDSKEATNDATVAAVALLGATGNITGAVMDDRIHKDALRRMIEVRGGMHNLGWNGSLELILLSSDIITSTISGSIPSFPAPDIASYSPIFPDFPKHLARTTYTPTGSLLEIQTSIQLLAYLVSLHSVLPSITAIDASTAHHAFTHLCIALQNRLLSLRTPSTHPTPLNQQDISICHFILVAAQICAFRHLHQLRQGSATLSALQQKAISLLHTIADVTLWEEQPDVDLIKMLIWACWVAGSTSSSPNIYAPHIARYMAIVGYGTWESVEECLSGFLWMRGDHGWSSRGLWELVQRYYVALSRN